MTERHPIDKYSKKSYQEGFDRLSETEKKINTHPLQAELAAHQELRKEAGTPYPFAEEEEKVRIAFEAETADIRREADAIKQDLWRQLSNAQTEAIKMNEERGSAERAKKVIPIIAQIEKDTIERIGIPNKNEDLPVKARAQGWAVINSAREVQREIAIQKSVSEIDKILVAFQKLYTEFTNLAGNVLGQNKYGHAI